MKKKEGLTTQQKKLARAEAELFRRPGHAVLVIDCGDEEPRRMGGTTARSSAVLDDMEAEHAERMKTAFDDEKTEGT